MTDAQIEALAVETRRQIFAKLLERPRSVQELADELPVSRPAVSQHLRKLVDAGLATSTTYGNRNVYAPDPDGLQHLRTWADRLWSSAMDSFAELVEREEKGPTMPMKTFEPVIKTRRIAAPPQATFDLFTRRIDDWWPTLTHSVSNDEASQVQLEPRVGGRIIEVTPDGDQHEWGRITEWEDGRRVTFSWYPGQTSELATQVEVSFRPTSEGTEMILIHTGWEVRGEDAAEIREGYENGWETVLAVYTNAASVAGE